MRPVADISKQLFEHDIPRLYARYVDGLFIRDFTLEWDENLPAFFTNGLECEFVDDLSISGFFTELNPGAKGAKRMSLTNTMFTKD